MEIDHFDPRKKMDVVQKYQNLFLASRHCNNSKRDLWPTKADRRMGLRFLNCCKEQDYGVHIFEDPTTHELIGTTPAGRYHIRCCDLNEPDLVAERRERAKIHRLLNDIPVTFRVSYPEVKPHIDALKEQYQHMIPPIPFLP